MAVKTVYIHPGDVLDIRLVWDKEEKPCKKTWECQSYIRTLPAQLIIHSYNEIGYCDFSYKFRLDNIDGSLRRWLQ
jgi:hypothetical protein